MNVKELRLRQVDAVLQEAASHPIPPRPLSGWLRAIREALGMSSAVLAQRLDISASGLRKLEQAEATDAITMALEAQQSEAASSTQQERLDEMAQEILRSGGARLWD